MDATLRSRLEQRLAQDPVANVMALKFLSLLGPASEGALVEEGSRWATWFHYAPGQYWYDAQQYADRSRIVYWNANDEALARTSADQLPAASVVKVSTEPCLTEAQRRWPRLNGYLWFSADEPVTAPVGAVEAYDEPVEDLMELSALNGYSRTALAEQKARGCRWFLARHQGTPASLCYVQPNYGGVWEVSGVLTRPEDRGRGLARTVVAAAVNHLLARGLTPRYFVHDQNAASLAVARGLGLEPRGQTQHFRVGGEAPRLSTDRLVLVPLAEPWAVDVFREFTPAVTRFMHPQPPSHLGDTRAFVAFAEQAARAGTDVHLVVTERATGAFQGLVGLHSLDTVEPELGIWLAVGAQGRGLGLEALTALVRWAEGLGRFRAFRYPVDRRNGPSRRIAECLGGTVVRDFVSTGEAGNHLDQVEYRIPAAGPKKD